MVLKPPPHLAAVPHLLCCDEIPARRVRSGRDVRAFLRGLGICLDSPAAVIRQARVTALADSNDPADLAALVAEASGLGGCWAPAGAGLWRVLPCAARRAVEGLPPALLHPRCFEVAKHHWQWHSNHGFTHGLA